MMDSNLSTVVKESLDVRHPCRLRPVRPSPRPRRAHPLRDPAPTAGPTQHGAGGLVHPSPARHPRSDLTRLLEGPGFDADAARALLTRLETDGLIRGDAELDLTSAGEARYQSLREDV